MWFIKHNKSHAYSSQSVCLGSKKVPYRTTYTTANIIIKIVYNPYKIVILSIDNDFNNYVNKYAFDLEMCFKCCFFIENLFMSLRSPFSRGKLKKLTIFFTTGPTDVFVKFEISVGFLTPLIFFKLKKCKKVLKNCQ